MFVNLLIANVGKTHNLQLLIDTRKLKTFLWYINVSDNHYNIEN